MTDSATDRYQQTSWSLDELLPDASEPTLTARFSELERQVARFERHRQELVPGLAAGRFLELLQQFESLVESLYVVGAFAMLRFAADTQDEETLTLKNRIEHQITAWENRLLFFSLWWKGLDDEEAGALLPPASEQPEFRHYLEDLRRLKPYTLEEQAEQIINLKDADGQRALLTLYSMLTNRLEFALEVDAETQMLTRDELMSHVFSPLPERRAAAYRELHRVYEREAPILAQVYVNRVRDWFGENVDMRGFASPIDVRNVANDVPGKAVEALLAVTREHVGLFQRYFERKAAWLGMDRLRRYDLYAPLAASERHISYADGVETVLSTFAEFSADFAGQARRVFKHGHIDGEVRKGKKGGAFCATVLPSQTPWVLVNYTNRPRDVATLAHELGHAVHSMFAEEHSVLTQHPSLPLAETASVFAEMLLTDRLLESEGDVTVQRELLASAVDDIYATVVRQAYFVLFEQQAHEAIRDGSSPVELGDMYLALLAEQFGESVDVAPEFRFEWVSIPHIFHTPFYCYAYSFGQLLVLALYRRYRFEGEDFVPQYLRLLARGGSARPQEILSEAGVDMSDADFWRGGFDVVREMVERLEGLDA